MSAAPRKKFLIDTHTFLWLRAQPEKVSRRALNICRTAETAIYLSKASIWEIAIKSSLGKLSIPEKLDKFIHRAVEENALTLLEIELSHLAHLEALPFSHKDPFDRLLISQAMVESMPVITSDIGFKRYRGLKVVW